MCHVSRWEATFQPQGRHPVDVGSHDCQYHLSEDRGCHLNVLEHVGMVADLLQLHDCVH